MGTTNVPNTPPGKLDAIITWINTLQAKMLARGILPHAGFSPLVPVTSATNLAGAIVIANLLKAAYTLHIADTGAHLAADATNTVAAAVATDQGTVNTLLTELKADFNAHVALAASHYNLGGAGGPAAVATIATADATDLASSVALADALLAAYNRHTLGAPTLTLVAS